MMAALGIAKTRLRPRVSNDNPYSEANFETLTYRFEMPERFSSAQDARAQFAPLPDWCRHHHHHGGLALLTAYEVHYGLAAEIIVARQRRLEAPYAVRPERFPVGCRESFGWRRRSGSIHRIPARLFNSSLGMPSRSHQDPTRTGPGFRSAAAGRSEWRSGR